ncbi:hypothetical protein Tco_0806867 [Tanacetum coccineum]
MLGTQAVEGEGSGQPTKPQYTPTSASPSHVEPIQTVASPSQPKKTHKHRRTNRKATEISQSSGPTILIADETVHEERRDRMERAATTASSLEAEQDNGSILRTQSMATLNEPISQGTCLENIETAQDLEITNLKKRVKKLEKKKKVRTPQLKRRLFKVKIEYSIEKSLETQGRYGHDIEINIASTSITTASINITTAKPITTTSAPVTTAGVSVSTTEPSTPPTTMTIFFEDEDLTIAQTLMKMRSVKSKVKPKEKGVSSETTTRLTRGVIMREASETTTRPIDTIEARIDAYAQLAERLQAEEREQMSVKERARLLMELIKARKKLFIAKRAEEQRNKPPTKAEQRKKMCTYMKHMAGYKDKNFKGKSFDAIKQMFDKAYKQLDEESTKRQKVEDDAEKAELKACLEIVLGDDSAIIRADGSAKSYKILSAMLDDFDNQDVLDLYSSSDLSSHITRSRRVFRYILLVKIKLLIKKLEDSKVTAADEDCRKYSKSLLQLG